MSTVGKLQFSTTHVRFCLWYCTLSYLAFNLINYSSFARWFTLRNGTDYPGLVAFFVVGLFLYIFIFLLLAHRYTTKALAILLTLAGVPAVYFIHKYNVAVDNTMVMNVLHTDSSEVHSLLSWQMLPYATGLMILPILVITRTRIAYQKNYFLTSLKFMAIALSMSVGVAYAQFDSISRAGNVSKKLIVHSLVPINIIQSFGSIAQESLQPYLSARKKDIDVTGQITRNRNLVVVLAVGETARQASFSLYGYKRQNTTPNLLQQEHLHVLNGKARLGSTLYALPEILTKDDVSLPAFTAKIGIDTVCYVNYTLYDNCISPGEIAVANCAHGGVCYDEDVLPLLENKLKSHAAGYSLIVLHLGGGSHGPSYQERYPEEFQKFKPMCTDADVVNQCSREQLFNSYDNTILYTDHVLGKILQTLDNSTLPYVFIYVSDHGESLLENGHVFHGMPPGIALPPEQARVPLVIKSSVPITVSQREEYEQRDVFDTVLTLFSVKSELHDERRSFIEHGN